MINIILCDNDESALALIKRHIELIKADIPHEINIISYTNGEDVLKLLRASRDSADILITDIDMPGLSGMEMAKKMRDEGMDIIIIFMTAYSKYVFKAFEYMPFRYIRKEYMKEELLPALLTACDKAALSQKSSLSVKTREGTELIFIKDILYYALENRKCAIYTVQNKKYETWKKISELRSEMGKNDELFLQVYRGCMVNKSYVRKIEDNLLVLENNIKIPISIRKKQELSNAMMYYWSKII